MATQTITMEPLSARIPSDLYLWLAQLQVDGATVATDTSAPYTANWNLRKASAGSHLLRVRATDTKGNSAEQSFTVTVK